MDATEYHERRRFANTPFGEIAYVERGSGPVALFLHGYPLNGYQWREIIERLSDVRRCIAVDLMSAGYTRTALDQDVSYPAQARMIAAFLDALNIEQVDLVGNDSGSAVSQIFAARHARRLRSLALTNSVVHDQWPPPALVWLVDAARVGIYKTRLKRLLGDLEQFRANLRHVFEHPERLTDETLRTYYEPFVASEVSGQNLERFIISIEARHTVEIETLLKELCVPTLILWGTGLLAQSDDPRRARGHRTSRCQGLVSGRIPRVRQRKTAGALETRRPEWRFVMTGMLFGHRHDGIVSLTCRRAKRARHRLRDHTAATACRHWFAASARKIRSVERETRWR